MLGLKFGRCSVAYQMHKSHLCRSNLQPTCECKKTQVAGVCVGIGGKMRSIPLILAAAAKRAKLAPLLLVDCASCEMKNTRWVELQRVENYDLDPISRFTLSCPEPL